MTNTKVIITILACAIVTFSIRAFPFVIFGNKKEMPPIVKYLSDYLSPAIIATLLVYCLKDVFVQSAKLNYAIFIAIIVTAIIHKLKKNTLFSITVGTIAYMILI